MKLHEFIDELIEKEDISISFRDRNIAMNSTTTSEEDDEFESLVNEYKRGIWKNRIGALFIEIMILA